MENNIYSIQQIFSERYFIIPDYQRGYAWEETQCMELIEDIEMLPIGFNHYTGTFVIKPIESKALNNEGVNFNGYEIVDGQQRITSIIILLTVIQNELQNFKQLTTLKEGLIKNYLYSKRESDDSPLYKLTLNADCKEYFIKHILNNSNSLSGVKILSHQRLTGALNFFTKYFKEKQNTFNDELKYVEWLKSLILKITQQLKLTIYVVEKSSEVGVIFEVMNNRGKDLTELEKVKNYLLYLTSKLNIETKETLAEEINTVWSDIFQGFMSAGLVSESENQLLRANWLFSINYNKREWDKSKSIKEKFNLKNYENQHLNLFNELKEYVQLLKDSSIAFADIENPERAGSFNSISKKSERDSIVRMGVKLKRTKTIASFRPLLIACRLKNIKSSKEYLELLELLEKFAFRIYNMQEKRADTGQSALFKIAYEYYNDIIDKHEMLTEVKRVLKKYSNEIVFNDWWELDEHDNDFYHWSALRYLLYEYEDNLAIKNKGFVTEDWDKFNNRDLKDTIEHILPQSPNSNYWKAHFKKKDIKFYLHDLGNLCLTLNNSSYSNKDFPDKKGKGNQTSQPCYATSSLFQERELANKRDWTVNAIKERRKRIINWAKERWYIDYTGIDLKEEDIEESSDYFAFTE